MYVPGMGTEGLGRRGPPLGYPSEEEWAPGLCAARVTELRSQATCARTSALRGFALLRWGSGTRSMNFTAACETGCEMIMWRDESASGSDWRFTELLLLWGSPCSSDSWPGAQGVAWRPQGECGRGSPR